MDFTASGDKQSSYVYTLTLTQSYTAGSTTVTYNYSLKCTTSNNYYYQDTGTTRICKIRLGSTEQELFNNYAQISVNKNGDTILDSGSITLNRLDANAAYTPEVYFQVYTTASSSYLPGYATHPYSAGIAVPARASVCGAPSITAPTANSKVSRTGGFTLKWNAGTSGTNNPITGYQIQYAIGSGSWTNLTTTNASTTSCTIIPSSYSAAEEDNFKVRIKCIETIDLGTGWSGTLTLVVNKRITSAPTINKENQTIASTSTGVSVTATKSSSASGVKWYSGSTVIGTSATVTINPSAGSSLQYTVYNVDAIGELSTAFATITITKNTKPVVNSLSITLGKGSGVSVAYNYIITSASATRSKTAQEHAWRIKYGTNNATYTISSSATISNYNLFSAITSTTNGAINYTIEYCYKDAYEWSDWKVSSSYSIGGSVTNIAVYNKYDNSNVTGTDIVAGSFYDKGRLYYKIAGYNDPNFTVISMKTGSTNLTVGTKDTGYSNFSIPTTFTEGATYTITFTLRSTVGQTWTISPTFTITMCSNPLGSVYLYVGATTNKISSFKPYKIEDGATTRVTIGQPIGALISKNLMIYSSSTSNGSSNTNTLCTHPTSTTSGSTFTTPEFNQSLLYTITSYDINGTKTQGNDWYSSRDTDGQDFYIVVKYTNSLNKSFTANYPLKIDFINTPTITTVLSYTIAGYANLKLQYNKVLQVTSTIRTYNSGTYTIELQWKPSGGSWSKLAYTTKTPGGDQRDTSVSISKTLGELTSARYDLRFVVYHQNRTTYTAVKDLTAGADNAIKCYTGKVTFTGFDKNNKLAQYSITSGDYGGNTGDGYTSIQAKFQGHTVDSTTFVDYSNVVTGSAFTNGSSIATNSSFPSEWTQLTGRIWIEITCTQTVDSSTTVTSSLTYYSNELSFYNTLATVSYRKNYLGVNAASFSNTDVLVIQSLDDRANIRLVKDTTVGTVALTSTGMALTNFIIDCGSW